MLDLGELPHLETLQMSHNRLKKAEDIAHLSKCAALTCIDLTHNQLDDPGIIEVIYYNFVYI